MLRKLLAALLLSLPLAAVRAQTAPPAPCNCPESFREMQRLIETNYAGYRDKVTPATRPRLDSLTRVVQARADTAQAASCVVVLRQWLAFFQDGHLGIQDNQPPPPPNPAAIRARYAAAERLPWARASFRAYLDDPARPKQPLEGIWRDAGNNYAVGVVADKPAHYQAFVLRADSVWWMPGQLKFAFDAPTASPAAGTYRMQNHAQEPRRVTLPADGVISLDDARWYRTYPRPVPVPAAPGPLALHSFRMLDDTTALYRIGSFDGQYRHRIDSLTKANAANLRRTKLLILDLRDNGGGSDGSYRSLTPYLYTQPVRGVGVALWSTPENNARYANVGTLIPGASLPEKIYISRLYRRLQAQPNQFVKQRKKQQLVETKKLARGRQHPEVARVAVLQNRRCGSTTEQFLLEARQSQKTTLFGENSAGVLDYANVNNTPLPCPRQRLVWATSRSYRLDRGEGIDGVGIAPTVRLDPTAPDMVAQVRAWYQRPRR